MTDKIIHILSNLLKTVITICIAIIAGILVGIAGWSEPLDFIMGFIAGIVVFWILCPYDTKQWIRNWTKPSDNE